MLVQLVELGSRAVSWAINRATWRVMAGTIGGCVARLGAQDGSIWRRVARSGCLGRPDWLDLVANDCLIDTITKKNRYAYAYRLLRCCLLRSLWNVSSCLRSSCIIICAPQ